MLFWPNLRSKHHENLPAIQSMQRRRNNHARWALWICQRELSVEGTVDHTDLCTNMDSIQWGHLCIQWNPSIPTPWNEDTSVYSGTPLFQWGHLCIQWNSSIPTPWNEDTSVCSGTLLRINVWQAETWQESQLVRGEGKTDFDLNKILMCSDWTCACQNGIKCFVLVFAGSLLVLLLVVELASTNPSIKKMEIPLY